MANGIKQMAAAFGRPGRVYIYSRYAPRQDGQLATGINKSVN
jgi:hypothetical protein